MPSDGQMFNPRSSGIAPAATPVPSQLANIAKCKALAYLWLDEAKLTEKQLAALRTSLPKLKLNGKPWKERGK